MFGVIADDFTGACDTGVQFRKNEFETFVLVLTQDLSNIDSNCDTLVVDTETRNLSSKTAYEKVGQAIQVLKDRGAQLVYKKIDSTLRGNLGAELDAVLDTLDFDAAIVTPSFPTYGRTTVKGRVLVNNLPLERTEFAKDPTSPVKESCIATSIGRQSHRKIVTIDLSRIRESTESLRNKIHDAVKDGNEVIIADAETQDDLRRIAEASRESKILPCGSAGLALEVSRLLRSKTKESLLLVISGSVNSVTQSQIAAAKEELGATVLEPNVSAAIVSDENRQREVEELVSKAEKAIMERKDIIIRLCKSEEMVRKVQKSGERIGISRIHVTERLLSVLSQGYKILSGRHQFGGLVLIGGDTSFRIINDADVGIFSIDKEILPGVPLFRIRNGPNKGMRVITKAGGFGNDHTLVEVMRYLKGETTI